MPITRPNADRETDPLHVDPLHVDRAIARIRAYRLAQGWSISRLASEAGMTESVLRRIDEPDWNPEAKTLRKLERVVPADVVPAEEKVVGAKARRDE